MEKKTIKATNESSFSFTSLSDPRSRDKSYQNSFLSKQNGGGPNILSKTPSEISQKESFTQDKGYLQEETKISYGSSFESSDEKIARLEKELDIQKNQLNQLIGSHIRFENNIMNLVSELKQEIVDLQKANETKDEEIRDLKKIMELHKRAINNLQNKRNEQGAQLTKDTEEEKTVERVHEATQRPQMISEDKLPIGELEGGGQISEIQVQTNSVSVSSVGLLHEIAEEIGEVYYITKTGSSYHRDRCDYLKQSKISITKEELEKLKRVKKLTPCKMCFK
eukprot:TRINITY_DN3808_c0_g1_i3.p1 TRINITY_DN3808_c0_g1~~TRINITY_DN3808_c0_g1_i3.p1  ORF type:complete len:280 (-),score=32.61 TRINITY_DN3808_c0_g1_i3:101-940(-)